MAMRVSKRKSSMMKAPETSPCVFPSSKEHSLSSRTLGTSGNWEKRRQRSCAHRAARHSFVMLATVILLYLLFPKTSRRRKKSMDGEFGQFHGLGPFHEIVHLRIAYLDDPIQRTFLRQDSIEKRTLKSVAPMSSTEKSAELEDSVEHARRKAEAFETANCKAMFSWQLDTFPTCNSIHEIAMAKSCLVEPWKAEISEKIFLARGYWRDVWLLRNRSFLDAFPVVFKTLRFRHNVTSRNFDRNRRDALVMEHFTKSTWVLDVYGFCANAGVYEYASGGDITNSIWTKSKDQNQGDIRIPANITSQQQMHIAVQAAMALAELHNFDKAGRASIAHTDITPAQFVKVQDGRFKLQDFNRARFIRWDDQMQKSCPYNVSSNHGKNRSPEEYNHQPQTEKVDVYSLGNLFFMLLQKEWPFQSIAVKEAQNMVRNGYRPTIAKSVWNSPDPYDQALKEAMIMCHVHKPNQRASADQVAEFLKKKLETMDPGILGSWGVSSAS